MSIIYNKFYFFNINAHQMKNKNSQKIRMQSHKILSISELYPEENFAPEEYIKEIPRHILLRYAFMFLKDFDHMRPNETTGIFLRRYFEKYKSKIYLEWEWKIQQIAQATGLNVTILYPLSNFKFFEIVFNQPDFILGPLDNDYVEKSNINIIKCYLTVNRIFVDKEMKAAESLKHLPVSEILLRMSFMGSLMESDLTKYNPLIYFQTQLVKCYHFFMFLSSDNEMKEFLIQFLTLYKTRSVNHFMVRLASLFQADWENEDGISRIYTNSEKYPNMHEFIRMFLLNRISDKNDFLEIRGKPLIELNSFTYAVIYEKFIADKLYLGTFFEIKQIVSGSKLKKRKNYLSIIGEDFFEKNLSYYYLNKITNSKSIKLSGKDICTLRNKNNGGEPDYYIRDFGNIFLFEVKNTLIHSDIKYSFDYPIIESYLKERFLYSSSGKNKIIIQLIENIKLILNDKCDYDKLELKKIKNIYAIAILPEETFSSYGMNYITNRWFQDEITKVKMTISYQIKVKPLILISIDTLIYLNYYIQNGWVKFKDLIDEYISNYLEHKSYDRQKISFALFATGYIQDRHLPIISFDSLKIDDGGVFSINLI